MGAALLLTATIALPAGCTDPVESPPAPKPTATPVVRDALDMCEARVQWVADESDYLLVIIESFVSALDAQNWDSAAYQYAALSSDVPFYVAYARDVADECGSLVDGSELLAAARETEAGWEMMVAEVCPALEPLGFDC